ncbi:MAG: SOS response-associated peptidase [Chitinophagaceae bacterium]|nr:SOS response-associated peptidase [Chitinophagaceae bacterium]
MCFHSKQSKSAQELKNRFKATFENEALFQPTIYNGFQFPQTPVITDKQPNTIQLFNWGLIPFWAKDDSIKKNTLNARIETIHEKPSFRNAVNNRCLILADGFYEWQWIDDKGKQKQKYLITLSNDELFAFAGLWSEWIDKQTGELFNTYTILTTEANELMTEIHNTKKRMPIIIANENDWLSGQQLIMKNEQLIAQKV